MKNIWDAMCRQMAFNLFRDRSYLREPKRGERYALRMKRGILEAENGASEA